MIRLFAVLLLALAPLPAAAETLPGTSNPQGGRSTVALLRAFEGQASRNGASVLQSGKDNEAVLSQSGTDDQGIIVQRGRGHAASLGQTNTGNSYTILQLGRGAAAEVAQTGGQAGATVQIGGRDR